LQYNIKLENELRDGGVVVETRETHTEEPWP